MKTPYTLLSSALIYPYSKRGKGGVTVATTELIENYSPIKDNDRRDIAKCAIINKALYNFLNN